MVKVGSSPSAMVMTLTLSACDITASLREVPAATYQSRSIATVREVFASPRSDEATMVRTRQPHVAVIDGHEAFPWNAF